MGIGVKAAGHCMMDNSFLLLIQQLDEPPLVANETVDAMVLCIEVPDNLCLFLKSWKNNAQIEQIIWPKSCPYSITYLIEHSTKIQIEKLMVKVTDVATIN